MKFMFDPEDRNIPGAYTEDVCRERQYVCVLRPGETLESLKEHYDYKMRVIKALYDPNARGEWDATGFVIHYKVEYEQLYIDTDNPLELVKQYGLVIRWLEEDQMYEIGQEKE